MAWIAPVIIAMNSQRRNDQDDGDWDPGDPFPTWKDVLWIAVWTILLTGAGIGGGLLLFHFFG